MVALTAQQLDTLDRYVNQRFVATLAAELVAIYTTLLQPLPLPLVQRMVSRMIDHAETAYGIAQQNALTTYLHYCYAIGPNFDQQPAIRKALTDVTEYPDDIPSQLPDKISPKVWRLAEEQADLNAWFDNSPTGIADRCMARYAWALPAHASKQTEAEINSHLLLAREQARALKIADEDGLIAVMVCQRVLGPAFTTLHQPHWISPICDSRQLPVVLRSATLRGCLELDYGIFI